MLMSRGWLLAVARNPASILRVVRATLQFRERELSAGA